MKRFNPESTIDGGDLDIGNDLTAGAGTTSIAYDLGLIRKARLTLTAERLTILEANDYGSIELVTFPNKHILLLGVVMDLTATGDGETGGVETITDVDVAIGSVATTSTDFSNAGEKAYMAKVDVQAAGVTEGASTSSEAPVLITAGAANKLILNASCSITADGYVDLTGWIDVFYIDQGKAA
jgi:hypothetical protein